MGTIREVAEAAGVSLSTVSRTFTAPQLVNPGTRDRVHKIASDLGYTPGRARRPSPGPTSKLGLIVPDIANPFFPPVIKAVQARARQRGFAVLLADSDEHVADEIELAHLMAREVSGLVIVSPRAGRRQLDQVRRLVPTVLVNRQIAGAPSVVIDHAEGMERAVQLLDALGHRRLAYLAGPRSSWANQQRWAAVQAECQRLNLDVVQFGPFEALLRSGVAAADLLSSSAASGVIAYDDSIGLGLLGRLVERGVQPGRDVSIIGVDDSPMATLSHPSLTTVHVPGDQAGTAAVELLCDLLESPRVTDVIRLDTYLVVRGSTGPAPSGIASRGS